MKLKLVLAWTGIFIIAIIPILLLLFLGPGDYSSITHTLGQISGLVGMTLFALSFIFSTRAKWIENLFGGLDKVYPVHAIIGASSLVLLLAHPLLLVAKFITTNMALAAKYLLPGGLISVDLGIFALYGMIILLAITIYGKIKYNYWKFSHEFLGLLFILAILHIFLVRTTVARDYIFKGYYAYAIIVSIIGLGAFLYSLLRKKLFAKKYKVSKVINYKNCFEISLEPVNKGIKFKSGQFVFVTFYNKSLPRESHPFSIAAPSGKGNVRIIAKNLGDFTGLLGKLNLGDAVRVEGPYGRFHQKGFGNEVWVAGGIGITPFLGLAQDLKNHSSGNIDLYYSVRSKDEFVCLDDLHELAHSNKKFRLFTWISNEQGYLSVEDIEKHTPLKGNKFYLCGPDSLKIAIRKSLIKNNIPADDIHDERFAFK